MDKTTIKTVFALISLVAAAIFFAQGNKIDAQIFLLLTLVAELA